MRFDWDEFHPLDHHIFDPYCWGWAGGIPRHLSLWWNYQFHWPWQPYFAKRACDKGLHEVVAYWQGLPSRERIELGMADGLMCAHCDWVRKA